MRRLAVLWVWTVPALLAAVAWSTTTSGAVPPAGIHKIQHVVVIMQENRSFDQYFGTYPGANGLPAGVCVPDPANGVARSLSLSSLSRQMNRQPST